MDFELIVSIFPEEKKLRKEMIFLFTLGSLLFTLLISFYFPSLHFFFICIGASILYLAFQSYRNQFLNQDVIKIQEGYFVYFKSHQKILSFSMQSIEKSTYREGFAIHLKKPIAGKIKFHSETFSYSTFFEKAKSQNCDLYFPGFLRSDFEKFLF